jgi:hypothetical protein
MYLSTRLLYLCIYRQSAYTFVSIDKALIPMYLSINRSIDLSIHADTDIYRDTDTHTHIRM